MKKIILITMILIASCFLLAGCISGVPHRSLVAPWGDYEECTYETSRMLRDGDEDATNNPKVMGTTTITTTKINDGPVSIEDMSMDMFTGSLIVINTVFEDGSTIYESIAMGNGQPYMSYKRLNVIGREGQTPSETLTEVTKGRYFDKKYQYTNITNGVEISGEIALGKKWDSKPYFDNLSIYHVVRSSYEKNKFTPITMQVPSWKDNELKTLTSNVIVTDAKLTDSIAPEVSCDQIAIGFTPTKPITSGGLPFLAYITLEETTIDGMKIPKRTLLAFSEGDISFKLKTVKLAK